MKRLIAISLTLATAMLAGCVVTPAYRYSGGQSGYYYSDGGGYGDNATVIYQGGYAYPYNPYNGYYYYGGAWVPYAGASVYYYDRDGRRFDAYRHDGDHYDGRRYGGGGYGGDGYRHRLSEAVRDQAGPRQPFQQRRLSQPRSASRAEGRSPNRTRERVWHDKRHHR